MEKGRGQLGPGARGRTFRVKILGGGIFFLLPSLGQAANDGAGEATLTGTVWPLGQEAPAAGVWVQVLSLETGNQQPVRTDAQGRFTFDPLPIGSYHLSLEIEPGIAAERLVYVGPGWNHCDLRPAPAAWRKLLALLWGILLAVLVATALVALSLVARPAVGNSVLMKGFHGEEARNNLLLVSPHPDIPIAAAKEVGRISLKAAAIWLGTFVLLHLLAPWAQPVDLKIAAFLSALALSWITVAAMAGVVAAGVPGSWLLPGLLLGLLLGMGFYQEKLTPALQGAGLGLALLMWVTCAGILLARSLRQPSTLVLIALLVALADVFNVWFGPAAALAAGQAAGWLRDWGRISLLAVPLLGSNDTIPLIGAGDFLFPALFLEAARKFELGFHRTYGAIIAAFVGGLISLLLTGRAIPALVFISLTFLLVHWRKIQPKPDERRRIFVFCGGMMLFFTVLVLLQKGWGG